MREITKDDLKPFPNLKYLYLDHNNIKVLEPNLFIHNPNLEIIWFRPNPIEHIDPNVFKSLSNLKRLLLGSCTNGPDFGDAHNQVNINVMLLSVETEGCSPMGVVDDETKINNLNLKVTTFKQNLDVCAKKLANLGSMTEEASNMKQERDLALEENEDLKLTVKKLTADNETCKKKSKKLETSVGNLNDEVESLTKNNEEMKTKFEQLRELVNQCGD